MNIIFPQIIICKILLLYFLSASETLAESFSPDSSDPSALVTNASVCQQYCPGGKNMGKSVPYPFGFSTGCKIQLTCNQIGEIMIGEYVVQNVTSNNILIDFPMNCGRRIEDLKSLNNDNFGISWRNTLLMQNCSLTFGSCTIFIRKLNSQLSMESCDVNSENVTCYSQSSENSTLLDISKLNESNCSTVFSSFAVDLDSVDLNTSKQSSAVSLEFATVKLDWWLKDCECDSFAKKVNVSNWNGSLGCRCQCNDGYVGDGFQAGNGCDISNFGSISDALHDDQPHVHKVQDPIIIRDGPITRFQEKKAREAYAKLIQAVNEEGKCLKADDPSIFSLLSVDWA